MLKWLWRLSDRIARALPVWAWIGLFALAGGLVGIGGFTFFHAEALSYLSDDPRACANCHVMREVYDAWNHGSHKAVATCNDCHTPHYSIVAKYFVKAYNGWNHSKAFTLNEIPEPIRIVSFDRGIAYDNCIACHADMVSQMAHVDDPNPTDCLKCHWYVGHDQ